MESLKKEALLALAAPVTRTVDVQQWGGSIMLRRMGALAYSRVQQLSRSLQSGNAEHSMRFGLEYLANCIVDPETLEPVFDVASLDRLAEQYPEAIERLMQEALDLHGATKTARENLEKNSERTVSDGGGSDSPGSADTPTRTCCSPS